MESKQRSRKDSLELLQSKQDDQTNLPNSASESDEESSEEETSDIKFPRDNVDDLKQYLHREITNISNLENN